MTTPAEGKPFAGVGISGQWQLVMFDVDSTLIVGEVVEMLAERCGQRAEVERITTAAMEGQLDFAASLRRRVALLAGLDAAVLDEVGRSLQLTPGAVELVTRLKAAGVHCGIASGGFTHVCHYLVDRLELDFCAANLLEVVDGRLTGEIVGTIVDRAGKASALRAFAEQYGVEMARTVAIGDGANDIDMLRAAGLSIAFNAKALLRQQADVCLDEPDLLPVWDILHRSQIDTDSN